MPTIIDTSYFKNEPLYIPDSEIVPDMQDNNPTGQNRLENAIARYEWLLLVNALGKEQYDLLIAGLEDTSGKWFDLLNGKTYDGKYWPGLKNENSLIAYYVYHEYLTNDRVKYTTVGLERSMSKNSQAVNPTEKLTEMWNVFVEMYGYREQCYYGYPWFTVLGYCQEAKKEAFVSFYQFISDFPDDYSAEYFEGYAIKNRFGL